MTFVPCRYENLKTFILDNNLIKGLYPWKKYNCEAMKAFSWPQYQTVFFDFQHTADLYPSTMQGPYE
ncbi:MAG: hypothetical protein C0403_14725 [Desulfobacterium sp.]|nr:hypothetical protein [Desulfobacterium sp.]